MDKIVIIILIRERSFDLGFIDWVGCNRLRCCFVLCVLLFFASRGGELLPAFTRCQAQFQRPFLIYSLYL